MIFEFTVSLKSVFRLFRKGEFCKKSDCRKYLPDCISAATGLYLSQL